eukprot:3266085-Rhodomonas_salina.1
MLGADAFCAFCRKRSSRPGVTMWRRRWGQFSRVLGSTQQVNSAICLRELETMPGTDAVRSACASDRRCPVLTPVSYTHLTLPTICSV